MNDFAPMPDDGALDQAAAEWLFERESGFAPEREKAFAEWCAADPRNAEALARVERTLELLGEMPAVRTELGARLSASGSGEQPRRAARVLTFPRLLWAAGLAATLVFAVYSWKRLTPAVEPQEHYATDATAQRSLALPDGSVMDINTASEVAVQFTPKERRIVLRKGEAHFQVAHNVDRPFIVSAGDVAVRAVGTAFDVRLGAEAVNVVVVEGKVALSRTVAKSTSAPVQAPPVLRSGERAQLTLSAPAAAPKIEPIDAGSISAMLTWQNPMTSFTDVPLRDVITRFNRRNPTQLVLEDADLGERRIGGMIALDQVEAFVRLLEQDGDIVANRALPGQITLRRAH